MLQSQLRKIAFSVEFQNGKDVTESDIILYIIIQSNGVNSLS